MHSLNVALAPLRLPDTSTDYLSVSGTYHFIVELQRSFWTHVSRFRM